MSGRIRVLRTHASYTVLVVGRGPFGTSGRILFFRTHACHTVPVMDLVLFLVFRTHVDRKDASCIYQDASIVSGRASILTWYALNTAVLVLVLIDRELLCQSQRRLLDCLLCNESVKETFYCEESYKNLQAVGGSNY